MKKVQSDNTNWSESAVYEIRVKGHLQVRRTTQFEGLAVICEPDGTTLLSGSLPDQTALHSILLRIRNMNLKLISIRQVSGNGENNSNQSEKEGD